MPFSIARHTASTITIAAALALQACGGGGGDNDTDSQAQTYPGTLEGAYDAGWSLTSLAAHVIKLDDGETWLIHGDYERTAFSAPIIAKLELKEPGVYESVGPAYQASTTGASPRTMRLYKQSLTQKEWFIRTGPEEVRESWTLGHDLLGGRYETDAKMSDVTGQWGDGGRSTPHLVIDADGTVDMRVGGSACHITGMIQPRSPGRNIFKVSFPDGGCGYPAGLEGIAFVKRFLPSSDPTVEFKGYQLIIALATASRDFGVVVGGWQVPSQIDR